MATKSQLEQRIAELESKLNRISPVLDAMTLGGYEVIPVGKIQECGGHAFEEEIRYSVCDQWSKSENSAGWMAFEVNWKMDVPFNYFVAHVTYNDSDGTYVSKFCPAVLGDRIRG